MNDFEKNVLCNTHQFWGLAEQIKNQLIKINENPNIQTLYSRKNPFKMGDIMGSYLQFAYVKEIELSIFREIIPSLFMFSKEQDLFKYEFNFPKTKNKENNSIPMGCLDNNQYFNINSVKLYFDCRNHDTDLLFWETITEKLSKIDY